VGEKTPTGSKAKTAHQICIEIAVMIYMTLREKKQTEDGV
jgi:hypothetical protein